MAESIKSLFALRYRTKIVPERIEVIGSGGVETFMIAADANYRELNYDFAAKNDILTSSNGISNNQDTSKIWGDNFVIKMVFKSGSYQKLYQYIARVKTRPRSNNS